MSAVWAIVVTRNRKAILRACLDALAGQTRKPDHVLVVDNASTDATQEMLACDYGDVEVLALAHNEGGAGGFHAGMRRAHAAGAEWMWLMDDDTIPRADALAELLSAHGRLDRAAPPTLLASKVVWRNGLAHPMNFPTLERARVERVIDAAQRGVIAIRAATFVSLLAHRGIVDRHGLPLKHFFLWSDDIEFTSRAILHHEPAYLVPSSIALHDTSEPHTAWSAPPEKFYFHVRNTVYMIRGPNRPWRDRLLRAWVLVNTTARYLRRYPSRPSAVAIARGLRDGLRWRAGARELQSPARAPETQTTASPRPPAHRRQRAGTR